MGFRGLKRRLPSHGTVVAYVALFIALGGVSAYAAATIGSDDIKRDAIRSKHVKGDALKGGDVRESTLTPGGVLTSRFREPQGTFEAPTAFGPVSGLDPEIGESEGPAQMVSPDQAMVAGDMFVYFDHISNNGGRRLTLRVDGADTALSCEATANFASATCAPPAGTEVTIPARSKLAWMTDRGSAGFNTAGTDISASLTLTPAD
jgi:hypothetical protein